MKYLYKTVRVVHDVHLSEYKVQYRKWFRWIEDRQYRYDRPTTKQYYCPQDRAKELAIARAEDLLNTAVVWQQSLVTYG